MIWLLATACLLGFLLMTANSYRYWRICMRLENEIGIPHKYPTFGSWQEKVWSLAMKDFRKLMGVDS